MTGSTKTVEEIQLNSTGTGVPVQLHFLSSGRLDRQAGEFEYDWLIHYLETYVLFYGSRSS